MAATTIRTWTSFGPPKIRLYCRLLLKWTPPTSHSKHNRRRYSLKVQSNKLDGRVKKVGLERRVSKIKMVVQLSVAKKGFCRGFFCSNFRCLWSYSSRKIYKHCEYRSPCWEKQRKCLTSSWGLFSDGLWVSTNHSARNYSAYCIIFDLTTVLKYQCHCHYN